MAKTQVRVVGGGNTYVTVGNGDSRVSFIAQLQDQPGRIAAQPVPIQGIGDRYPVEIATAYAQGAGTLTLTVWERWGKDGWISAFENDDIFSNYTSEVAKGSGFASYPADLVEVLDAQRKNDSYISIKKVEKGADGNTIRIKSYNNAVITDIDASENVSNESMEKKVKITVMYTNITITN